jgi:hypothetical protein
MVPAEQRTALILSVKLSRRRADPVGWADPRQWADATGGPIGLAGDPLEGLILSVGRVRASELIPSEG